jgi:pimeloyl-ACP methyl ester carboxylesterase
LTRLAAVLGSLLMAAGLMVTPAQARSGECELVNVPVTLPGTPNAKVYGELCLPSNDAPKSVQLLVPGSTSTHVYYDWPQEAERYSYVDRALAAGHATLSVDRIGSGQSTRPPSAQITLEVGADTLHQVITWLREGRGPGRTFDRVVWVGNSLGSIYAWVEAARHQDVDAFVLTSMTHRLKPSFAPEVGSSYHPAPQDPKFADSGYDPGYLTTVPGSRPASFFHLPGADPKVVELDERLKNTTSGVELNQAVGLINAPPADTAPSRRIKVPTLLVLGDHDAFFCGAPDGIECTKQGVLESEGPYYSPEARLNAIIAPNAGHSIQLHLSAPETTRQIMQWVNSVTP